MTAAGAIHDLRLGYFLSPPFLPLPLPLPLDEGFGGLGLLSFFLLESLLELSLLPEVDGLGSVLSAFQLLLGLVAGELSPPALLETLLDLLLSPLSTVGDLREVLLLLWGLLLPLLGEIIGDLVLDLETDLDLVWDLVRDRDLVRDLEPPLELFLELLAVLLDTLLDLDFLLFLAVDRRLFSSSTIWRSFRCRVVEVPPLTEAWISSFICL